MASSEKVPIAHQNRQQQILKCPRCDSSNTKFCYYNNYSLSQPRHFCKACKRYWTRGGTLRNVPVGGGCRKNKRSTNKRTLATNVPVGHHSNSNPNLDHHVVLPSSTPTNNNNFNPLFGLSQPDSKYPRFDTRVSHISHTDLSKYNRVHPHMGSFGLGFSSSDPSWATVMANNHTRDSISLVSSYPSMINNGGATSTTSTSNPMMASFQQQPRFLGFAPYGDGTKSSMDSSNTFNGQNHNDQIKGAESSDPTFLWNTAGGDGGDDQWFDPTSNICSSVPSLI
ncbi:hypothetical protein OSB04_008198 [Centaurea solstitialis]|uniref:Dof zinc finger protein n=1 Tax=Centaurea solstitialis TaxID=347529 RepID=A0AA38TLB5_9ASTR|nr:hypothetical protein OSB04_008198 [Centaurea solstitialis]